MIFSLDVWENVSLTDGTQITSTLSHAIRVTGEKGSADWQINPEIYFYTLTRMISKAKLNKICGFRKEKKVFFASLKPSSNAEAGNRLMVERKLC